MEKYINDRQVIMVQDIRLGLRDLPKSHEEFANAVAEILTTVDHDALEKEPMRRCRIGFLKAYLSRGGSLKVQMLPNFEGVYLSHMSDKLKDRKYFRDLSRLTNARKADAFREIYQSFIKKGEAIRIGEKLKFKVDVEELLRDEQSYRL
ncbi:hypothetical protein NVP1225O_70 [Vibrio phage 1.225.O._10N.261.48.B7]|nr:hypothetical protein NVP1225O_70 [Vibrio phage 1.225.O._10N.261.48.B7]